MSTSLIGLLTLLISAWALSAPPALLAQAGGQALPSNLERARGILREGLDSKDFKIRIQAIAAVGMVGRNEALLKQLDAFLRDKNVEVRLAAVHTLADLRFPQSEESLHKVLEDDDTPEVSFAAAKVLAGWQDSAGTSFLKEIYDGKRKSQSGLLQREERNFVGEFHSVPSALIFIVGKGIGYAPVPGAGEGFSAVTLLMKDPGVSDRAHVLLILGRTRSAESSELLRKALQDHDWSVRAVAAQMIAQTAQAKLGDALPPLFDDKNRKVRFQAAGAYLHVLLVAKQQ